MAITWADNFQSYGIDATGASRMQDGGYQEVRGNTFPVEDPDPNLTSNVLRTTGGIAVSIAFPTLRKDYPSAQATVGAAFRFWSSGFWNTDRGGDCFGFKDGSGNLLSTIFITPTGRIRVYRGNPISNNLHGET